MRENINTRIEATHNITDERLVAYGLYFNIINGLHKSRRDFLSIVRTQFTSGEYFYWQRDRKFYDVLTQYTNDEIIAVEKKLRAWKLIAPRGEVWRNRRYIIQVSGWSARVEKFAKVNKYGSVSTTNNIDRAYGTQNEVEARKIASKYRHGRVMIRELATTKRGAK